MINKRIRWYTLSDILSTCGIAQREKERREKREERREKREERIKEEGWGLKIEASPLIYSNP